MPCPFRPPFSPPSSRDCLLPPSSPSSEPSKSEVAWQKPFVSWPISVVMLVAIPRPSLPKDLPSPSPPMDLLPPPPEPHPLHFGITPSTGQERTSTHRPWKT